MTDPYDRLSPGTPPAKGPSLFSPLRPIKYSFYLVLLFHRSFHGWLLNKEVWKNDLTFVTRLAAVVLILGGLVPMFIGIGPWAFLPIAAYIGFYIFIFAAFHLDDDDRWADWKHRLLS